MGKKTRPVGRCALCQEHGLLTFEHFPPRSVGNTVPVVTTTMEEWAATPLSQRRPLRGRTEQRGAGGYLLCATCNNWAGRHLVSEYQRWAKPLAAFFSSVEGITLGQLADASEQQTIVAVTFEHQLRPGRFARYALQCCLLGAANQHEAPFAPSWKQLVTTFGPQQLPEDFGRLVATLNAGPMTNLSGTTGLASGIGTSDEMTTICLAEAVGSPWTFAVISEGRLPAGSLDITDWLEQSADEAVPAATFTELALGFSHTAIPGDRRTFAQVQRQSGELVEPHPYYRGPSDEVQLVGRFGVVDEKAGTLTHLKLSIPGHWDLPGARELPQRTGTTTSALPPSESIQV